MKTRHPIIEELESLGSPLAKWPHDTPYRLPEGYFDELQQGLSAWTSEEAQLSFGKIDAPFSAPAPGYFENLSEQVLFQINESEAAAWTKAQPYSVPEGYFDQLIPSVLEKVKDEEEHQTKVIPFKPYTWRKSVQLAAAAMVFLLGGLGALRYSQSGAGANYQHSDIQLTAIEKINQLDDTEIESYINNNIDQFETDLLLSALSGPEELPSDDLDFDREDILDYLLDDGGFES